MGPVAAARDALARGQDRAARDQVRAVGGAVQPRLVAATVNNNSWIGATARPETTTYNARVLVPGVQLPSGQERVFSGQTEVEQGWADG